MSLFKRPFKFGEALEVTWVDATGSGAWEEVSNLPQLPVVKELGYYIREDSESLCLAMGIPDRDAEQTILGPSVIPKGCIKSIRRIK